ncbi:DUF4932 domain-containing protein [Thermococcus sp. 9N3]|nr:DUF4932 domain-containing protein [Thermococcus sp. 9N3]
MKGWRCFLVLSLVLVLSQFQFVSLPGVLSSEESSQSSSGCYVAPSIEINPNLELFAVLYILAFNGSDYFITAPKDYISDVLTYFAPYRDDPAVKYIREVFNSSLPLYARDNGIMEFSSRLALLGYLPNETNLGELELLANFARKSDFMTFYSAHRSEYEEITRPLVGYLECVPEEYERLFGHTYESFRVEASYSLHIHPHVVFENETVYYVGGLYYTNNVTMLSYVVATLHEFTHPFVRDFLDRNFRTFENMSYYLQEVRNELPTTTTYDPGHYSSFHTYLNELFTESIAEYIALRCGVPGDYVLFRAKAMSAMFLPFWNLFDEYRKAEELNETLYQYAPTLARHMGEWATSENVSAFYRKVAPVVEPSVLDRASYLGKLVIVYGTQNPDESGNEYDRETAYSLADRLRETYMKLYGGAHSIVVKADGNLTDEDLRGNLILIGGPVANAITARLNENLPVRFAFNGSWLLRRNPNAVENFTAFRVTENNISVIPPNSSVPLGVFGVIETIRNPWNSKEYVLIIAGLDRYGTREMTKWIQWQSYMIRGETYWEVGFYSMG